MAGLSFRAYSGNDRYLIYLLLQESPSLHDPQPCKARFILGTNERIAAARSLC